MAVSRRFRVRAVLLRSCSRWSRNAVMVEVEVGPVEPMGLDSFGVVDPGEEQAERVPVGDGARTDLALAEEPVGEEALQRRSDRAHGSTIPGSMRRAASASSSGAADKYQYVDRMGNVDRER